jgi:hypothetical protein
MSELGWHIGFDEMPLSFDEQVLHRCPFTLHST